MELPKLNLPYHPLRLKEENGITKVFDSIRAKYVALTPEEFVRQQFVAWLIEDRHYPASLMANETAVMFNGMNKRCDTVVFNRDGSPLLIVEYKAPNIKISQQTFDQLVRYNMVLHAKYLIVSNGMNHYCCVIDYQGNTYHFIPTIPDYNDLNNAFSNN